MKDTVYTRRLKKVLYGKRWVTGCILLAAGFVLLWISRCFRGFSDWYNRYVYQRIVGLTGRFFGMFPFSVSEIGLYILIGLFVMWCVELFRAFREKEKRLIALERWGSKVFLTVSILLFLYASCCGVNYYCTTFAEREGIAAGDYTTEDLREVCLWLTGELETGSLQVERDESQVMRLKCMEDESRSHARIRIQKEAVAAMEHLGNRDRCLCGYYPQPKGLLIPQILAVQSLSGVYSPFTVEANYNSGMVDYNLPFTMCHELSHLRGFMQEKEANYIAFLACTQSDNPEFEYSGYMLGWINCMNVLYRSDYDAWEEVCSRFPKQCEADLAANSAYWEHYDGVVAEVSNEVNDSYLKANGQEEGVKSYDRMVDLIVAQYKHPAQ